MEVSNFLSQIGLGNLDIGYVLLALVILVIVLIIINIVSFVKISNIKKRLRKFMKGKDARSLEKEIIALHEDNKFLKNMTDTNKKDIRDLNKRFAKAFQKIGLVKYDAYQQMGGLLSFSLALLDEDNNGLILNSVHSTEGCYTYTKEVVYGECKLELSNEEKVALDQAMGV
jgi:hypothetical protein